MVTATATKEEAKVNENQPPKFKARRGAYQIAYWRNTVLDNKGDEFISVTGTLERGYTDQDGNWVNERLRIREKDIGNIIALLQGMQQSLLVVDTTE